MKFAFYDSYLATIKNSVRTQMFKTAYVRHHNKKIDILKKGQLSCAFFVSSVLKIFNLISRFHTTVKSTVEDLENSDWRKIKKPRKGAVLHWEKKNGHEHLGFYIGNQRAISNSSKKRTPVIHHWTYNNKRKVIAIYWNKKLV